MKTMETPGATNGDKFGIKEESAVIPRWAYVLAAIIFVGIPICFRTLIWRDPDQPGQFFGILFPFVMGTILAFLALMIGYVNRDAGRRGMNRTLWTLIVIFVPNAIGFILYFLLRNPRQTHCIKCNALIDARVNYCPHCRHSLHPACPQCKAAVRPGEAFCGNCGVQLEPVKN